MATKLKTVEDELTAIDAARIHPNLNAALIAAQAELPAPRKDREVEVFSRRTNSKYKFRYATMAGMMETDKPVLSRHGLGFVQFASDGAMVTRILHASGESLDCPLPMPSLPDAPQEAGSLITYFKRYSYCAAFGRVADEEDDANIAEGNGYTPRTTANPSTGDPRRRESVALDGPYNTVPKLEKAAKEFVHSLRGMSSLEEFDEWAADPEVKGFVEQCKRDLPDWWTYGPTTPPDFIPLEIEVRDTRRGLKQIAEMESN